MHPYPRAYVAGIAVPTMIVPFVVAGLPVAPTTTRPFHIEDALILVPNCGLSNVLYVCLRRMREIPIGRCLSR